MKHKTYTNVFLFAVFSVLSVTASAQTDRLGNTLERATWQAQRTQNATVSVTAKLQKPVYMSDVMFRRPRGKDVVIRLKQDERNCKGILVQGNTQIVIPAVCVEREDYTLSQLRMSFANGHTAQISSQQVRVSGDIAFIAIDKSWTNGLRGLKIGSIAPGKTLRQTFGVKIETALLDFFHRKGIPAKQRLRIGASIHAGSTLTVGEPFIYQDRVVALVQKVPYTFRRGFWGDVPEEHLALIRF